MTGDEAKIVIEKVLALKNLRNAVWDAMENLSRLQARELNTAADCLSAVIDDLEAKL